jgi:hypothetical protein
MFQEQLDSETLLRSHQTSQHNRATRHHHALQAALFRRSTNRGFLARTPEANVSSERNQYGNELNYSAHLMQTSSRAKLLEILEEASPIVRDDVYEGGEGEEGYNDQEHMIRPYRR